MKEQLHIPEGVPMSTTSGSPKRILVIAIVTLSVSLVIIACLFLYVFRPEPVPDIQPFTPREKTEPVAKPLTPEDRLKEFGEAPVIDEATRSALNAERRAELNTATAPDELTDAERAALNEQRMKEFGQ